MISIYYFEYAFSDSFTLSTPPVLTQPFQGYLPSLAFLQTIILPIFEVYLLPYLFAGLFGMILDILFEDEFDGFRFISIPFCVLNRLLGGYGLNFIDFHPEVLFIFLFFQLLPLSLLFLFIFPFLQNAIQFRVQN